MPLPRTMTPKKCEHCSTAVFVNENGSTYEDTNRLQYHTDTRCIAVRLATLLKVAKMIQRELKANDGYVSIEVEAELDDAIIATTADDKSIRDENCACSAK